MESNGSQWLLVERVKGLRWVPNPTEISWNSLLQLGIPANNVAVLYPRLLTCAGQRDFVQHHTATDVTVA